MDSGEAATVRPAMVASHVKWLLAGSLLILLFSFLVVWIFNTSYQVNTPAAPVQDQSRDRGTIDHLLQDAGNRAAKVINDRNDELLRSINAHHSGIRAFAEEITSLHGKWEVMQDWLPFTDPEGHRKYVAQQFEVHVLSRAGLARLVRIALEGSIKDLDAIQNELAVALRQELLGRALEPGEILMAEAAFRTTMKELIDAAKGDALKGATSLVVSEIASQVGIRVMLRLGVSAGFIGAGAVNAWWSFGASVIIGFVADELWSWIDDPVGDIEREVHNALQTLASKVGLSVREEMMKFVTQRRMQWKTIAERDFL